MNSTFSEDTEGDCSGSSSSTNGGMYDPVVGAMRQTQTSAVQPTLQGASNGNSQAIFKGTIYPTNVGGDDKAVFEREGNHLANRREGQKGGCGHQKLVVVGLVSYGTIVTILLAFVAVMSFYRSPQPAPSNTPLLSPSGGSQITSFAPDPASASAPSAAETLVVLDDFNSFDLSFWEHEITEGGGGNWEFQYYTNNRTNSFVDPTTSTLVIQPTLTMDTLGVDPVVGGTTLDLYGSTPADQCTGPKWWGCSRTTMDGNIVNPVQSARLRTSSSFSFQYGRVEARIKLPKGDWLWPAFWLLPRYHAYGTWPASGEIDIMESRGNVNYPDELGGGLDSFGSTLHWGPSATYNGYPLSHSVYKIPHKTLADEFHVYGLYWNSSHLYTYIDDPSNKVLSIKLTSPTFWERGIQNKVWPSTLSNPWRGQGIGKSGSKSKPTSAPFDQEFYLIFNVAVGGVTNYWETSNKPWTADHAATQFWSNRGQWLPTWGLPNCDEDRNKSHSSMQVDWLKVWVFPESSYTLRGVHYPPKV